MALCTLHPEKAHTQTASCAPVRARMPPVRMHTSDSSGGTDLPSVALTGAHGRPTPSETGASATHDGGHAHKRSYSSSLCTESGFVVRTPPSLRNPLVEEVAAH